jgi:excisionase family DNA binding protein
VTHKLLPTHPDDRQITASTSKFAYSIVDSADLVSISRSQLYVEIQEGRLAATKVGGRTLILHEDLIAWLRNLPRKAAGGGRR